MTRSNNGSSRRDFLKSSTAATITAGLASGLIVPRDVHAGGTETLKVGLVGCGGRGRGAVQNALNADPRVQLTAVADAFDDCAHSSVKYLRSVPSMADRIHVDDDQIFVGFDAYRKVIDNVDVVILATPPHFRPEHLEYAVEKGKHLFVEKPVAVDVVGAERVRSACKRADEKGLSIVSGLCWRYDNGVNETIGRVLDGDVGDIVAIQSSYNGNTLWHRGNDPSWSRMEYQMRNWMYYTWLSGDHIVEQAVHSVDKCAWLLGDCHPLRAVGMGGRQQRTEAKYGHIFDHHSVVFDFPNHVKVFFTCRQQDNVAREVEEHVLGTKGQAHILGHQIETTESERPWRYRGPKSNMYLAEHEALFASIRNATPLNNGEYMCNSTLIAIMGRTATYTGKVIEWDEFVTDKQRLGPEAYEWGDVPEPAVAIPGVA